MRLCGCKDKGPHGKNCNQHRDVGAYLDEVFATPKTILQEAHEIIYGDREQTYGKPSANLERIANYWNAHLMNLGVISDLSMGIDEADVCLMMAMVKFARQINLPKRDNLVDAAGYIALIERL